MLLLLLLRSLVMVLLWLVLHLLVLMRSLL